VKLQQCWQAREYEPMQPLLMPDLYITHCAQLAGLRRDHEINMIDSLHVERVDIVNVRYTQKENEREFTALVTASAKDYYVDDRDHHFLRGDEEPARFQEFWTFQWHEGAWLLREIEQSRESDKLKEENFFEQFTDKGVAQVYGKEAGKEGPAGPWLEKSVETKATRIERLLNYLVQTDKLWDRQAMLERARAVFTRVMLAREANDPTAVRDEDLFPAAAVDLRQQIAKQRSAGMSVEYRNLCVRKVELVLVRNYSDNTRDEFVARISAHAQRVIKQGGAVSQQDEYVSPWEEYWTFGRLDGQWKLKEVLPPAAGAGLVGQENVDEDTSAAQLQWYYQHPRAT
jgi:predicted lipid-binding transport protein (Tim44 family)